MPETATSTGLVKRLSLASAGVADVGLAVGVVAILLVMILPVPTPLLDLLLTFNVTFGIIVLLTAMYILKPLDFSVFPSLLLILTLYRLSLNVASTRLILLRGSEGEAAAGQVIKAFGSFVVGGNYVVGIIVFAILVIINFVVITKGATRIAEVAARFTLDAMPGKQMAIDADLNAGLIDEGQARARRSEIAREADFYGAMDGAAKFVRGDAIAGIIITFINILGGLIIGVLQQDMTLVSAAQTYTVLTVGDGLVSQVPALIISTAAGVIVSRAGSEVTMGAEFTKQFTLQPRAMMVAGGISFLFGLLPGLPRAPFMFLGGVVMFTGYMILRQSAVAQEMQKVEEAKAASVPPPPERVEALLPLDVLELEVGYGLIPLVDEEQDGELLDRIRSIRRQFALEMGFVVPPMHVRDNLQLKPGEYSVLIRGIEVARAEIMMNHFLAMDPGDVRRKVDGIDTREPAFNLPALWIAEAKKEDAQLAGYTVVDPSTVIATHITELIRTYADELLSRQDVQKLLDTAGQTDHKVVEELIPGVMNVGQVQKVLQNLLRERVSIRDLQTILETLADYGSMTKDAELLTEFVRQKLARSLLVRQYESPDGQLPVMTLGQDIEDLMQKSLKESERGAYMALDPELGQAILNAVNKAMETFARTNYQPLVLTSPIIRRHFRKLIERFVPNLVVLSHNEMTPTVQLKVLGDVRLGREN